MLTSVLIYGAAWFAIGCVTGPMIGKFLKSRDL